MKIKKFNWDVKVVRLETRDEETVKYSASHNIPVTAEHVRKSPSVKRFIGDDLLVSITPSDY
jgi:hypothetical protein